jgi:pullulanase/glycogen debranching enzyme
MQIIPGSVYPLGPSAYHSEDGSVSGVNFAVASAHAKNVQLVLFDVQGEELSTLNLFFNEEEGVWHGAVPNLPQKDILYGVKVSGDGGWETPFRWDSQRVLLDPWAPYVVGRSRFGMRDEFDRFVSPVRRFCLKHDVAVFFPWSKTDV